VKFGHVAEAVTMGLAAYVCRKPAQDISYQTCCSSVDTARSLLDVAGESVRVETTAEELEKLCDPMGCAPDGRRCSEARKWEAMSR
jgi:hypothetical protein